MHACGFLLLVTIVAIKVLAIPLPAPSLQDGNFNGRAAPAPDILRVNDESIKDKVKELIKAYPEALAHPEWSERLENPMWTAAELYKQEPRAALHCLKLYSLVREFIPSESTLQQIIDFCANRHGYKPDVWSDDPYWKKMQELANREGRTKGISPETDYDSLPPSEKKLADILIRGADDLIEKRYGRRPQRGPDRKVLPENSDSNNHFSANTPAWGQNLLNNFGSAVTRAISAGHKGMKSNLLMPTFQIPKGLLIETPVMAP
ncbi:MAG: hypothetical protein M1816_003721 [Peltula sp. TS41687]|nr:MAG: hypothetical protein M1816_003721 [Peltula sp. TS41687]